MSLANTNPDLKWHKSFFDITTECNTDSKAMDPLRTCAALHIKNSLLHKAMKDTFVAKLGTNGIAEMQERKWCMTRHDGKEALRTNIGFLMGKNPNHGFSIDCELHMSNHLSDKCSIETKINVDRCNHRTTDGQKSSSAWNHSRPFQSQDNHSSNQNSKTCEQPLHFLRADKKQEAACNTAILNVKCVPEMCTGIPIIGISSAGTDHLRQELQANPPNAPTPVNLESTHLSERLGKHMVTAPLSCIAVVKNHVEISLSQNPSLHLDDKFATGPMPQERRRAPIQGPDNKDNDSNSLFDPCGDVSVASVGSSKASTTMSHRARPQQAIAALAPLKPHRPNAWHVTLPKEMLSQQLFQSPQPKTQSQQRTNPAFPQQQHH